MSHAADDRKLLLFAFDGVDDADDGQDERGEIDEPQEHPEHDEREQEERAENPDGELDHEEDQALLHMELYERVILSNKERDDDQRAEV